MKNTIKITFTGILIALMFVLSWTVLGMIPLGVASATTVFVPLCIGIVICDDFRYSLVLGLFFGIVSLIRSFVPQGFLDSYFQNPIVSVLPRLLVGIICHFIYKGLNKITTKRALAVSLTGASVALLNTVLTMSTLVLVNYTDVTVSFAENGFTVWGALGTIALLNMLPEIVVGAIVPLVIVKVIDKIKYKEA